MKRIRKQKDAFWYFLLLIAAVVALYVYRTGRGPDHVAHPVWVTDFEQAQALADQQNKDMFLLFTGSDWCPWCVRLDREVLTDAAFVTPAQSDFIFVLLDFPRNKSNQSESLRQQNQRLADQYVVQGYPTVVLTDAKGVPYARTGYRQGGGEAYLEHVRQLQAKKQPAGSAPQAANSQ